MCKDPQMVCSSKIKKGQYEGKKQEVETEIGGGRLIRQKFTAISQLEMSYLCCWEGVKRGSHTLNIFDDEKYKGIGQELLGNSVYKWKISLPMSKEIDLWV